MRRLLKRRIAFAVAALALLAGGTAVALGATGGSHTSHAHHGRGILSVASSYLGIGRSQLSADLRSGESLAQVADATPGHSAAGLEAALLTAEKQRLSARTAKLPERVSALVNKPGQSLARERRRRRALRETVLSYLGLQRKQLAAQLASGKSLAQIADATAGKSANGLIEAIDAHARQRLQDSLKSGHLKAAQAAERQSALLSRVTALVERVHPARSARHPQR